MTFFESHAEGSKISDRQARERKARRLDVRYVERGLRAKHTAIASCPGEVECPGVHLDSDLRSEMAAVQIADRNSVRGHQHAHYVQNDVRDYIVNPLAGMIADIHPKGGRWQQGPRSPGRWRSRRTRQPGRLAWRGMWIPGECALASSRRDHMCFSTDLHRQMDGVERPMKLDDVLQAHCEAVP